MLKWVYLAILIFITLLYINVLIFLIQFHFLTCANISSMWSLLCSNCIRRKGYCPGQNQGTQRGWCHCRRVASKDWFYNVWNFQAAWDGRIGRRNGTVEKHWKTSFWCSWGNCKQFLGRAVPLATKQNHSGFLFFLNYLLCAPGSFPWAHFNKTFWNHGHDVLLRVNLDA